MVISVEVGVGGCGQGCLASGIRGKVVDLVSDSV